MAKKKQTGFVGDLVIGGTTLGVGATVVGALPVSAAQTGVLSGMGAAGGFFPVMGTIGGAGMAMKGVRNLKDLKY